MFPGAGAQVYRNEAGEPIGWDYPSDNIDEQIWSEERQRLDEEYEISYERAEDEILWELGDAYDDTDDTEIERLVAERAKEIRKRWREEGR